MLIGFLLFVSIFYRVNYQYLVVYIPLALLLASRTPYKGERVLGFALALFPGLWMWLFNVSAWFNYLNPHSPWVTVIFTLLGWNIQNVPDLIYVIFALVLMCLSILYVILALTRWQNPWREKQWHKEEWKRVSL